MQSIELITGYKFILVTYLIFTVMNTLNKLRSNPLLFLQTCTNNELLEIFPIDQKNLNKCFKGNLSKYRKHYIEALKIGALEIY